MKNPKLDLHGVRHHEVDLIVENFIYKNQYNLPIIVICGNSEKMIEIVKKTIIRTNFLFEDHRYGVILVK